ncbi:hypothetical protein HBH56_155330 [Parastagonospora nodorum]|uniref:Uncharacterized protein n=1 Tax=Phaeosphaeria nodorum (strain SN15 / ATCC MYA-4574 / FGSC 10173) TaxID=321614 RepID=A0A7U2F3I7_PHANO|nr:hypothetical protein HBH56_155330 [Parastagonospora nodorum]QRC95869.1 hypothetical protein JI435_408040 [Parastagonospora nodorum SN15]KAH3926707.1 hypothetical protein HBH54_162360 [Parastagonospora nodorum]KAH3943263.1 hypothetical protein HBH53_176790 [Parastagonospora nodorum]KAH3996814.1 hypothetical protein HBI10_150370 [Parastagonospora nodorum]
MKGRNGSSHGFFISGKEIGWACCASVIFMAQLMKHYSVFGRNGKHRSAFSSVEVPAQGYGCRTRVAFG